MSFQLHKELDTDLFLISLLMPIQKTKNNADLCEQQDDTGSSTLMYFYSTMKKLLETNP